MRWRLDMHSQNFLVFLREHAFGDSEEAVLGSQVHDGDPARGSEQAHSIVCIHQVYAHFWGALVFSTSSCVKLFRSLSPFTSKFQDKSAGDFGSRYNLLACGGCIRLAFTSSDIYHLSEGATGASEALEGWRVRTWMWVTSAPDSASLL